jgi:radical SAM-linked protein
MSDAYRRILVYFEKREEALGLSHLELMRALEDAVVASGLPVRMSEGERRKPKLGFATALPQGMTSRCEWMEVPVREDRTVGEVLRRLRPCAPPGIRIYDGDWLYPGEKVRLSEVVYEIGGDPALLPDEGEVAEVRAKERIPVERRGKEVDLKPLLSELSRDGDVLRAAIRWTETGTARPADVLAAFGRDPGEHPARKVAATLGTSLGESIRKPNDA